MKRGFILVFILLFIPFAFAYGGVGESCSGDEECSGVLFCENAVCSSPGNSVEIVAETIAVNEIQENLEEEEEMGSGGITSDNPFLGWADGLVDTVRSKTSNDPSVQERIVQEALGESKNVEQKLAQGQISEKAYAKAKTKSGEKSVKGIQRGYQTLSQQSLKGGNTQELENSRQQFDSLASRAEKDLSSLRSPLGNNKEFAEDIQNIRLELNSAAESFTPQESGPVETYTCASILEESVVGDFLVSPQSDGSLNLVDSSGSSYFISGNAERFSIYGDSIFAYAQKGSSVGNEVVFTSGGSGQSQNANKGEKSEGKRQIAVPTGRAIQNLVSIFGANVFAGTGRAVNGINPRQGIGGQAVQEQSSSSQETILAEEEIPISGSAQKQNIQVSKQSIEGQGVGSGKNKSQSSIGNEISQQRNKGQQGEIASEGKRSQAISGSSYYTISVDSQNVGSVDLNKYGQSVLAFGESIIYSYEVDMEGVRFLVGDSLVFYVSSAVEACQLQLEVPQEEFIGEEVLEQEGFETGVQGALNQADLQGEVAGSKESIQGGENIQQGPGARQNAEGQGLAGENRNQVSQERNQGQQGEIASEGRRQGVGGEVAQGGVASRNQSQVGTQIPSRERSQGSQVSQERNQGQQGEVASEGRRQGVGGTSSVSESSPRTRTQESVGSERQRTNTGVQGESSSQRSSASTGTKEIGQVQRTQSQQGQQQIPTGSAGSGPIGGGAARPVPTGQVANELFDGSSINILKFLFFRE